MNRGKRLVSLLLTFAMLFCSIPIGVVAQNDRLSVATWDGMELSDVVAQLNSAAGLPADNIDWKWLTAGTAEYTYSKIEVNVDKYAPGFGWQDATAEVNKRPNLAAEAERQLTVKEKADGAQPIYVPLTGYVQVKDSFIYTMPENVSYGDYTVPARATLHGKITYPAFDVATVGESATMQSGGVTYTVSFAPAKPVKLVQNKVSGVYQVSGDESDYQTAVIAAVLDMQQTSFGDGGFKESGLSVLVYDETAGRFVSLKEAKLTLGVQYRVQISYTGLCYSDTIEVSVVFSDTRTVVDVNLRDGVFEVMYQPSADFMQKLVYDQILTIVDTTESLNESMMQYEYYGSFDFSSLLATSIGAELKTQMRESIAAAFAAQGNDTMTGMEAEVLIETILTDEFLASAMKYEGWVPFGGGSYEIRATIAGQEVVLAAVDLPAIGVGSHRIRVTHAGSSLVFPFAVQSETAVLVVHPALEELEIDGQTGVATDAPYTEIQLDLTGSGVYVTLPTTLDGLFVLRAGTETVDAGLLYRTYLTEMPATFGAFLAIYQNEILTTPILSEALAIDPEMMQKLLFYFTDNMADMEISFEEPEAGCYFVVSTIGGKNYHSDFAFGPRMIGEGYQLNCYIGYAGGELVASLEKPTEPGQYWNLIYTDGGASMKPYTVGIEQISLQPGMQTVFVYDGLPHGEPLLWNGIEAIALTPDDIVRYYHTETGKMYETAPSAAGTYRAVVILGGEEGLTARHLEYEFSIETAVVSVTIPNYEIVYGEAMPEFEAIFGEGAPETLPGYKFVIEGYNGAPGTYLVTLQIESDQGFTYAITPGRLVINKLVLSIKIDDQNLVYGDKVDLTWALTEGEIPAGYTLPLTFSELPKNAGEYEISATTPDPNVELTVTAGKIVIAKKKVTLTVGTQTLWFGQEPIFTTTPAFYDPDVKLIYKIEGYNGKPGTYNVTAALSDDTNYDLTINPGKITFQKPQNIVITVNDLTVEWGDEPQFSVTAYTLVNGEEIPLPTIGLDFAFEIEKATSPLEIGTYKVKVKVSGAGLSNYPTPMTKKGNLTVVKKQVLIGVEDVDIVYGDPYNAEAYAFEVTLPEGLSVTYGSVDITGVGLYHVTVTVSGDYDRAHYEVSVHGGQVNVLPKKVVVTPTGGLSKYAGQDDPELIWTVDGLIGDDVLSGAPERVSGEYPGNYAIRLGTLSHPNYIIQIAPVEFVILAEAAESIILTQLPSKLEYLIGESLDITGMTVVLKYVSGKVEQLQAGQFSLIGFDPQSYGKQTVTVTYGDLSATFSVTVLGGELVLDDSRFTVSDGYLVIEFTKKAVKWQEILDAMISLHTVRLYKNGQEQTADAYVGTGMTIQVCMGDTVLQTLEVVMMGDVNGDGYVRTNDALLVLQHVSGKRQLQGAFLAAADAMASEGSIRMNDARKVLQWCSLFKK